MFSSKTSLSEWHDLKIGSGKYSKLNMFLSKDGSFVLVIYLNEIRWKFAQWFQNKNTSVFQLHLSIENKIYPDS